MDEASVAITGTSLLPLVVVVEVEVDVCDWTLAKKAAAGLLLLCIVVLDVFQ